jgi:hypothetical protein
MTGSDLAGRGLQAGDFFCDLAYTLLLIDDRDITGREVMAFGAGEFKEGDAHMVGISAGYKL